MRAAIVCGAAAMLLAGCGGPSENGQNRAHGGNAMSAEPVVSAPGNGSQAPELSREDEQAAKAAAGILQRYFALIATGDAGDAQALWQPQADNGQRFGDMVDRYAAFRVDMGTPGAPRPDGEGALRVAIPLILIATDADGTQIRREGQAVLRAANHADWRIANIDFVTRPEGSDQPAEAVTRTLDCIDGSRFSATFDPVSNEVVIGSKGKAIATLKAQPVASGILYRSGGYVLRGKGDRVTFSRPDAAPLPCRAS
ncbi:hypothetical protein EV664_106128 [Stakelama pacifica]|uniref:C-type lysozyme inhibitor domain-containing protein n=2 Tax=Stakelama pacifica TaxID=517720 RepID=A0A4R6FMU1_9SPHN|nr:hypothetical protein EV664_106128 [Stakelama pacifica]GGO95644.1 hypothetical protein GCM10011329_20280 [Stakelama pacifica]